MNQEFHLGESDKVKIRERYINEFLDRMFDNDDRPYFISNDACLYDIHAGDDVEFSQRFEKWYGKKLTQGDFRLPVWQLIDKIYG